jgi:hypothetical protein
MKKQKFKGGMGVLTPGRVFFLPSPHKTIMTCSLSLSGTNGGSMRLAQAPFKPGRIRGAMQRVVLEETMTYASPLSNTVPLLDQYKASVECMSWDEESGRLCLLLGSERARAFDEECPKEIVVIDFV